MTDEKATKALLSWIGDRCFYDVKDKRTKTNLSMEWVRSNANSFNWKWKHIKKAIQEKACTDVTQFKKLCNHFRDNDLD